MRFRSLLAIGMLLSLRSGASADLIRPTGPLDGRVTFTRIIVFGDSLSDTGNLAERTAWVDTDQGTRSYRHPAPPPKYTQFRFTCGKDTKPKSELDGLVWHEILADCLKLNRAKPSLTGGSNYAFGGAVTGDGTGYYGLVNNMGLQVEDFLKTGQVQKSDLYLMWGGGNDLFDAAKKKNAKAEDVKAAGKKAIENLGALIKKLIDKGAKTILWPNLPPLDQTPRGSKLKDDLKEALKAASEAFSEALLKKKAELEGGKEGVEIMDLDVFSEFGRMIKKEGKYSKLKNTTDTAQGKNVNPDEYIFWDEIHPTAQVHKWLGEFACERVPEPSTILACLAGLLVRVRRRAAA